MTSKNKTQYALLGMLSFKPMSGYEIKKNIVDNVSSFWSESYGQIYKTLNKLLKNKLINKRHIKRIGKPNKDVYSITNNGSKLLKQYLRESPTKLIIRDEVILKFILGFNIPNEYSIKLLENEIINIQERIKFEKDKMENEILYDEINNKTKYVKLLFELSQATLKTKLKWCKKAIKELQT